MRERTIEKQAEKMLKDDNAKQQAYFEETQILANQRIRLSDLVMSEIEAEVIRNRLDTDEEFAYAWQRNVSRRFYDYLYTNLSGSVPNNVILRWLGKPGKGKSLSSLYIVSLEHEFLNYDYVIVFSPMEASTYLALKSYQAVKDGIPFVSRTTIDIDEVNKTYGIGSGQEETYFSSMKDFLRKAQINLHILNPNDANDTDIKLETIGYTYDGYAKSILYWRDTKTSTQYRALGYVVTGKPPENYVNAYNQQKDEFLNQFMTNKSNRKFKEETLFQLVYENEMTQADKDMIRLGIILNKKEVNAFIKQKFKIFNLPDAYVDELVQQFKMYYFKDAIEENWRRTKQRLEMMDKTKTLKNINFKTYKNVKEEIEKNKEKQKEVEKEESKETGFEDLIKGFR